MPHAGVTGQAAGLHQAFRGWSVGLIELQHTGALLFYWFHGSRNAVAHHSDQQDATAGHLHYTSLDAVPLSLVRREGAASSVLRQACCVKLLTRTTDNSLCRTQSLRSLRIGLQIIDHIPFGILDQASRGEKRKARSEPITSAIHCEHRGGSA